MNPMLTTSPAVRRRPPAAARRQRGVSMILLLVLGALIFVIGGAALRVAPTVIEYQAIQKAINHALGEGGGDFEIRRAFDRAAAIDNITSITGKDLLIGEVDGATVVGFDYRKEVPLAGPVSLVVDYKRAGPPQ